MARRFLLPIFRLRLDFAIQLSKLTTIITLMKTLCFLIICGIINESKKPLSIFSPLLRSTEMIQCHDCEYYEATDDGRRVFKCDPFQNVKEPECLLKWQLLRLDMLLAGYRGMSAWQEKMAPMQDKILKYIKREIEDIDESEKWKLDDEDEGSIL